MWSRQNNRVSPQNVVVGSIADTGCFTATAEFAAIALTVDLAAADCFVDPGFHSIYELRDFIHKALSSSAHA